MASITTHKSNGEKSGIFPKLLRGMLRCLGHLECPLYKGFKEEVDDREEWRVEVYIDTQRHNKPLIFEAYGRRSTFEAGISDAARQAIFRVRDMYADELSNTPYRYFPHRRICNTRKRICRYNKHRRQHGPNLLFQQIRLTKALDAVCDEALDELRETRFKLREREEELEEALCSGHKAMNGNEGVSFGCSSAISDALPQAQDRFRGDRRPIPCVLAPCGRRRLARGGITNENSASSGAWGSSCIISGVSDALPQGHRDRPRPSNTQQKSFVIHPVAAKPPGRDGAPASSPLEGRVRGKVLMSINSDGSLALALGKEPAAPADAINHGDATTSSAPRSSATAMRIISKTV